jgi:hypothetical protein
MPTQVQFRRGTAAQNNNFTGAVGEISINTTNSTFRIHDGSTVGGFEVAKTANPAFTGTVTAVDITATGNITAPNLYAYSDEALKTDIVQINNAIEKVKALNGVYFTWKNNDRRSMGLIAQQVEPVEPVVVSNTPEGFKAVNYSSLVGLLIEAIKEQQVQIDDLKKQIDSL